jgi:protein involved in polysaccharide export with SLBB domain
MQRINQLRTAYALACTALLSPVVLSGCTSAPPLTVANAGPPEYTLDTNDRVRVSVFNNPALTGEFAVSGNGTISFPLIGNVDVRDKTIDQAQELIRSKLAAGYLNDPRVTLEVLNYRPFYILGEVARPGQYPFSTAMSLPQAVALAGGYTPRANTTTLLIKRSKDALERQVNVKTQNVYVLPGDTIRVKERYF